MSAGSSLKKDIGQFGDAHNDGQDSVACPTNMISHGDWSPETYCGRFHLLRLGLYFTLERGLNMGFHGLRRHGGTSPMAPKGVEPDPWAFRTGIIAYGTSSVIDSYTNYRLFPRPDGSANVVQVAATPAA